MIAIDVSFPAYDIWKWYPTISRLYGAFLLAQCPISATVFHPNSLPACQGTAQVRLLHGIHAHHHGPNGIVWFGHVHHGEVRRAGVLLVVLLLETGKKKLEKRLNNEQWWIFSMFEISWFMWIKTPGLKFGSLVRENALFDVIFMSRKLELGVYLHMAIKLIL